MPDIEITQTDRDAAAPILKLYGGQNYAIMREHVGDWYDNLAVVRAFARHRTEAIVEREDWQPIETAPQDGTCAVLYFPQHAHEGFDGLDYRYRLAIYRDGRWRDQGTNHDSFEGVDPSYDDTPTHWRPLPPPPAAKLETPDA